MRNPLFRVFPHPENSLYVEFEDFNQIETLLLIKLIQNLFLFILPTKLTYKTMYYIEDGKGTGLKK